jgi:hypothetical protein
MNFVKFHIKIKLHFYLPPKARIMFQRLKMKRCQTFFTFFSLFVVHPSVGQIMNYDGKGNRVKASSEQISIIVNKKADKKTESATPSISLPGIIGSVISLGVDVVKSVISAQEAKYTATYTATKSENELMYLRNHSNESSADLNIESINIARMFVRDDSAKVQAFDLELAPIVESNSGLFRFKVQRLSIPYTKAKVKKDGKGGKMINMSFTIKLDALWKEPGGSTKQDSSAHAKGSSASIVSGDNSFQIKTATLGESSILITSIYPGRDFLVDQDYYSGWFQLIPATALKYANGENKWRVGYYTLTVTVKEANPYAVDAKKLSDFFSATNPDISTLLKQLIPNSSK